MRCPRLLPHRTLASAAARAVFAGALLLSATFAEAQRHNLGSSPPTAPPPLLPAPQRARLAVPPAPAPVVSVNVGMGALEFFAVNYGVPAPQSLTRQLTSDDERTRSSALSAVGAPGQYLGHGHVPFPHSVHSDLVALGNTDELDAVVTVELDQHILSAVLEPVDGGWKRVGTMIYATPFNNFATSPGTFLHLERSLLQHDRYRAVFHARTEPMTGDFIENEAQVRIFNNRAVVTVSFISAMRDCDRPKSGCEVIRRWLQPDASDPTHRFVLITGSGRVAAHDAASSLAPADAFQIAHLRSFMCQPILFSETAQKFEPASGSAPCVDVGGKR